MAYYIPTMLGTSILTILLGVISQGFSIVDGFGFFSKWI